MSKEMSGREERAGFYYCISFVCPLLLCICRIFRDVRYVFIRVFIHYRDDLDSWWSIQYSKSCIVALTNKNTNFDNFLLISFLQSAI